MTTIAPQAPMITHAPIGLVGNAAPSNKPLKLFIDKITLTMAVHDPDHQKFICAQLIDLSKDKDCGWVSGAKGAYRVAARIHPPSTSFAPTSSPICKDYVLVQADPRNGEGGFLRAEWNSSRFSTLEVQYFFSEFDTSLDLPGSRSGMPR